MAVDFSLFAKYEPPAKKLNSYHTNDIREIEALQVTIEEMAPPQTFYVVMKKPLQIGVPLQIQFDITPFDYGKHEALDYSDIAVMHPYAYTCIINSVRARIKPGNAEFNDSEKEHLNKIIHEAKPKEVNRFTGLEL